MIYKLIYTETAIRQLKKLERKVQERIKAALERVRIRPYIHVSKMVGEPHYKVRVGDYRIIMDIEQQKLMILIIKVDHRKNIYNR